MKKLESDIAFNDLQIKPAKVSTFKQIKKSKTLILMCVPAIIFFFIFSYIPMPGLYLAFIKYNYAQGIFKSAFCGLDNFRFLFMSGEIWKLTRNTVLYNLAFIILGNLIQIFVAILLNEIRSKWFKKISQTIMFLPYFISAVIVGLFAYNFLNYDSGVLNHILKTFHQVPIKAYQTPWIWPIIIIAVFLWQGTGYGSIVYFAAIMGIDSEIMEAAEIDGANAFQRIRHILLPCLKPTFVILMLFSLGGILKGNFGLFYNLVGSSNTVLFDRTDIIETFVFRSLMNNFNFSLGSAVSLYQSVFGFIIVMTANWIVKKIEPDYSIF
ncbi:ABC transporter permease [Clostridium oryzae]|uniref:Putative multiple-sugar transport system permease YteP n=1 Tax=Clostridium oryzae TaxID=1450648 RepID=A0A1V4IZS3_9CLOT|nr:ABC transporter permease subunit [Clostridium oryzae]OPJ65265.1 putative multiple-sugar transport system permease YteP [Clostridium oryzae]